MGIIETPKIDYYKYSEHEGVPIVSNSRLNAFNPDQGGSPKKFKDGIDFESKRSSPLESGSALHTAILEPHKYIIAKNNRPSARLGEVCDYILNELAPSKAQKFISNFNKRLVAKAYDAQNYYANRTIEWRYNHFKENGALAYVREQLKSADKIFLTEDEERRVKGMAEAVRADLHEIVMPENGSPEKEIYWYEIVEITNEFGLPVEVKIPCKAKIDNHFPEVSINLPDKWTLVDLKTTSSAIPTFMGSKVMGDEEFIFKPGSFQKFRYYRQGAIYARAMQVAYNIEDIHSINVVFAVVNSYPPHETGVFTISNTYIDLGLQEFYSLLTKLAYCIHYNKWN